MKSGGRGWEPCSFKAAHRLSAAENNFGQNGAEHLAEPLPAFRLKHPPVLLTKHSLSWTESWKEMLTREKVTALFFLILPLARVTLMQKLVISMVKSTFCL